MTSKLRIFFQRFQTEVRALKVHETKITTEGAFNRDHFGIPDNPQSNNNERVLFWVFLQIFDPYINP